MKLALILALACGGSRVTALSAPLTEGEMCAAHAGADDCAPGGVCVTTAAAATICVCCGLDAGFAIDLLPPPGADCTSTRKWWLSVCPGTP